MVPITSILSALYGATCTARRTRSDPFVLHNYSRFIEFLAEVLEHGRGHIRTPTLTFQRPSVIRLVYLIKRPRPKVRLTRREIFLRDHFTCQYCGIKTRDLTLDHIIPRHRGGMHSWENLASACRSCNHKKGGKSLADS